MRVPDWWATLLLALAAYRSWRLLAQDEITDRPREWVLSRLPGVWGDEARLFVSCPWCLGAWVAIGWWAAWMMWPDATLTATVPFVLSSAVGLIVRNLDP